MRLADRTVLVTGAGSGIGRETTIRCAEEGATVIATDVDSEGGQETVDIVREADPDGVVEFEKLDVTNRAKFREVADETADQYGLDCVVNNAGIGHPPNEVEDVSDGTLQYVIDVNLKGVWNGCHTTLPHLKEGDDDAAIVNVSSLAGFLGFPKQSVYSLTKGAVLNFSRAVAAEAGPDGVRCNAVCPGFTDTPLGRQYFAEFDDEEAAMEKAAQQYPLRRLGEPNEIAEPILFLLSEDASWISGHGLVVDGGFSIS
ncbi:dehydrogenase [Halobacteriales archaeon QS_4_70_19]|nr:MAG: dehydrogenase [Halobacteriales archaeon QS_4_70_19]